MGLPVGMPAISHCEYICTRGRWHFSSTGHAVVQADGTCVCASRPQREHQRREVIRVVENHRAWTSPGLKRYKCSRRQRLGAAGAEHESHPSCSKMGTGTLLPCSTEPRPTGSIPVSCLSPHCLCSAMLCSDRNKELTLLGINLCFRPGQELTCTKSLLSRLSAAKCHVSTFLHTNHSCKGFARAVTARTQNPSAVWLGARSHSMSTSFSERFLHPLGSSFLAQKRSGSEQYTCYLSLLKCLLVAKQNSMLKIGDDRLGAKGGAKSLTQQPFLSNHAL